MMHKPETSRKLHNLMRHCERSDRVR